ncbi:MAG: CoxG family protein [Pigmentiphaga sp.]|uniref:CoxG family protein n=1 Tax=Pigmentiphaga sp. TaxID=1977564 RepID=UPI003B57F981
MKLEERHTLARSRDEVWGALNDPGVLRASIPGCEQIELGEDGAYRLAMKVAVGPVKARFSGTLSLLNVQAPESYTLLFEGSGGVMGFGKGSVDVRLEESAVDCTVLGYRAHAQVGGRIAQVGARLVEGVAAKMAAEFFARFEQQLTSNDRGA